jgi:hypothetical protein
MAAPPRPTRLPLEEIDVLQQAKHAIETLLLHTAKCRPLYHFNFRKVANLNRLGKRLVHEISDVIALDLPP